MGGIEGDAITLRGALAISLRTNSRPARRRAAQQVATIELRTARNISDNGMEVEQPKNGQVDQQIRRRPDGADAASRTTDGFFHSHAFGLAGSQGSPKTRQSSLRPTPNGDHHNSSANSTNRPTANRGKSRAVTAWELPDLIRPLPVRKHSCQRQPRLRDHYPAIVEFVYANRFATAAQIQRRFVDYLPSYRTTQYQLAGLVRLGYLQTAPVRSTSPNFPYVYSATKRGVNLIERAYSALRQSWTGVATESSRSRGMALPYLLHELFLTEFDLAVHEVIQNTELERVYLERRFFLRDRQLRYAINGRIKRLIPDSGFLVSRPDQQLGRTQRQQRLMMHFTELDNGTMSIRRLQGKFWRYRDWSQSEGRQYLKQLYSHYGSEVPTSNYRLLFIVHGSRTSDERRLLDVFIAAGGLPAAMRDRIWITTVGCLRAGRFGSSALEGRIWLRLRDTRAWANSGFSLNDSYERSLAAKRTLLGNQVASLPRHPLFAAA